MSQTRHEQQQMYDQLCRICNEIDFKWLLTHDMEKPIALGSWNSLLQRQQCPFCRLVVHALRTRTCAKPIATNHSIMLSNELSWKLGIQLSPYDRSKSETYSNKYDLRSKAKQSDHKAYRFLISSKANTEDRLCSRSVIQYVAHKEKSVDRRQFFGRKVDRAKVDFGLLRVWLDGCKKWHGVECERDIRSVENLPLQLRLIDVQRRRIVRLCRGEIPKYVALSYMWGTAAMKQETGMVPVVLLRKDIRTDASGDEVTPLKKNLPKTIEDAMTLTRELGYRYLWNDALCIVQDDSYEDKKPDLSNMKSIYSSSALTIAAAAGTHANHGIAGIGTARQKQQHSELVGGLRLATMFPSYNDLENSTELLWNTRGWTFQEKVLSQRMLLFTDYQVYFKCSESIWTEEIYLETERLSKSVETRKAKYAWHPGQKHHIPHLEAHFMQQVFDPKLQVDDEWSYLGGLLDYTSAVEEYCKRQLSDEKDVLWAFGGIMETLEPVCGRFTLGLPWKCFLDALLWRPNIGSICTRNGNLDLPSWTWASWNSKQGTISFEMRDVRHLRRMFTGHSVMGRLFMDKSFTGTYGNLISCLDCIFYPNITIKCVYHSDGKRMRRIKFEPLSNVFNVNEERLGIFRTMPGLNAGADKENVDWKPTTDDFPYDASILAFETSIIELKIGKPLQPRKGTDNDEIGIFELQNADNETIGELETTYGRAGASHAKQQFITISWGFSLQHATIHPRLVPTWRLDGQAKKSDYGAASEQSTKDDIHLFSHGASSGFAQLPMFRSLLHKVEPHVPGGWLSASVEGANTGDERGKGFYDDLYWAEKGRPMPRSLWSVVNLILIDWDGNIARRAGVGKIMLEAWQEQKATPREIMFG